MPPIDIDTIATQPDAIRDALRELNNLHQRETSYLSPEKWDFLVANAFSATCCGGQALLIAFDETAPYDNPNFNWFSERFVRFAYVDRIVVADGLRGQGAARRLYDNLFDESRAAGHERIVCEINAVPPNPASDAFHQKMGFLEVGSAELSGRGKTVRYFAKDL